MKPHILEHHIPEHPTIARRNGLIQISRHRLTGYLAQRVPSLFLASSFRMSLKCEVLKGMFPWRTRYPFSSVPIKLVPNLVRRTAARIYICICTYISISLSLYIYVYIHICIHLLYVYIYIHTHICMYMYVCIYIYIYISSTITTFVISIVISIMSLLSEVGSVGHAAGCCRPSELNKIESHASHRILGFRILGL